jgi:hypothetical protein
MRLSDRNEYFWEFRPPLCRDHEVVFAEQQAKVTQFVNISRISLRNRRNLTVASRAGHNLNCINVEFPARFGDLLPQRRDSTPERKLGVNVSVRRGLGRFSGPAAGLR